MAKQEQILIIQPQHELKFRGSLKAPITSFITLKNPSEHRVCFKIKTTAPKRYCVRPNSGILQANATMEIAVSLHPFDFDPNEKHKHKFMVQTMIAPEGEINVDQLLIPVETLKNTAEGIIKYIKKINEYDWLWGIVENSGVDSRGHPEYDNKRTAHSENTVHFQNSTSKNKTLCFEDYKQWKEVSPENLMDSKLKCVFEAPPEMSGTATTNSTESTVNTEDKTKRIGDSPSVNQDGELVKAAKEVKHLREEESSLRQENLMLKEEILRLRADQANSRFTPPTTPALNPPQTSPLFFIGVAIAVGFLGILLGKFLL